MQYHFPKFIPLVSLKGFQFIDLYIRGKNKYTDNAVLIVLQISVYLHNIWVL